MTFDKYMEGKECCKPQMSIQKLYSEPLPEWATKVHEYLLKAEKISRGRGR